MIHSKPHITIGLIASLILLIASSPFLMNKVTDYLPNPYEYGDLYIQHPKFNFAGKEEDVPLVKAKNKVKVDLVVLGDSYIMAKTEDSLYSAEKIRRLYRDKNEMPVPNKQDDLKDVLVVEFGERIMQKVFVNKFDTTTKAINLTNYTFTYLLSKLLTWNAEYNLKFFTNFNKPAYALRSVGNFFEDEILATPNNYTLEYKEHLILKSTTDTSIGSSCRLITQTYIDSIASALVSIEQYAYKVGYDKVIIALLPNPVTQLPEAETYFALNYLPNRVQDSYKGSAHFFNVYKFFKSKKEDLFLKKDTHWNNKGVNYFTDSLNHILAQL